MTSFSGMAATHLYPDRLGDVNDLLKENDYAKDHTNQLVTRYLTGPDSGLHGSLHSTLDASRGTVGQNFMANVVSEDEEAR